MRNITTNDEADQRFKFEKNSMLYIFNHGCVTTGCYVLYQVATQAALHLFYFFVFLIYIFYRALCKANKSYQNIWLAC